MTLPGSDTPITQVMSQMLLGVILDHNLTYEEHVESLGKWLSKRVGMFKRINTFLPRDVRVNFYCAIIKPLYINVRKFYLDIVF